MNFTTTGIGDTFTGALMGGFGGGLLAGAIITVLWVLLIFLFASYIYTSFAYMAIAKKAKHKTPAIAWIPVVGPLLITSKTAKMDWWPILLILGFGFPILGIFFKLAVAIFSTIWLWKTFEKIRITNWFAILCLIPIVNLVIIGIAAWSKR
jgi:membrane-bound acyltransferase YfiQ involved in biofilm formation